MCDRRRIRAGLPGGQPGEIANAGRLPKSFGMNTIRRNTIVAEPAGEGFDEVTGTAEEITGLRRLGDVAGQQGWVHAADRSAPVWVRATQRDDQAEPGEPKSQGVQFPGEDHVLARPAAVEQGDGDVELEVVSPAPICSMR
jgi:hypothetical protein